MTTCIYLKDNDKPFAYNQNYLFCDVCTLNDNPDEQFVIIIDEYRFMSGNEFVINLTESTLQYEREKSTYTNAIRHQSKNL